MFINLTPHDIHIKDRVISKSGIIARCCETTVNLGKTDEVDLILRKYGDVTDLPEPKENTIFIVSMLVRLALPNRHDIASPGDMERDKDGNIIGCCNLVVN
jgi:hypothetical protein